MDDAALVGGGQGVCEGEGDGVEPIDGKTAFREKLLERLAGDELHRQEVSALRLLDGEDGDDAGMIESGQGLRLATEALETLGVGGQLGRQHLESDFAPQLGVDGAENLAHPAGAELFDDLIVTDGGASHASWRFYPTVPRLAMRAEARYS